MMARHVFEDRVYHGDVGITGGLDTATLKVPSPNPPASASATGTPGQIEWDSGFIYVCIATDTWVRAALSSWT